MKRLNILLLLILLGSSFAVKLAYSGCNSEETGKPVTLTYVVTPEKASYDVGETFTIEFFVDGVSAGAATTVTVAADTTVQSYTYAGGVPDSPGDCTIEFKYTLNVIEECGIDLGIDANYDDVIDKIDDPIEETEGGLVSPEDRDDLIVSIDYPILNAEITYPEDKIKIYQGTTFIPSGSKIPAGKYQYEGIKISTVWREVEIKLVKGDEDPLKDGVTRTYGQIQDINRVTVVSKIISKTVKTAPDLTPDDRTKVGVCEEVIFHMKGLPSVTWTASSGSPRSGSGTYFQWTAPDVEGSVTITSTSAGGITSRLNMSVIKPTSAAWQNKLMGMMIYPLGKAGAGMLLADLTLTPPSVNFEYIQVTEVSGPASRLFGYFDPKSTGHHTSAPYHTASGVWMTISSGNKTPSGVKDTAGLKYGLNSPWYWGSFTWEIPYAYRDAANSGTSRAFTTVIQTFDLQNTGEMSVIKDNAVICNETRKP